MSREERELERPRRVERELVAGGEVHDPLAVRDRVEAKDLLEVGRAPRHGKRMRHKDRKGKVLGRLSPASPGGAR
jgi:hypothetical protein